MHDLRHTFATRSLGAGVNLKVVSQSLGDSQIGTTADIYLHVDPAMKQKHADRLKATLGDAVRDALKAVLASAV